MLNIQNQSDINLQDQVYISTLRRETITEVQITKCTALQTLFGLQKLKQIQRMLINDCAQLRDVSVFEVASFQELTQLHINNTVINEITLYNLQNLKQLIINNNQLIIIEGIEWLSQLEELQLINNKLQSIPKIQDLINIKILILSKNSLYSTNQLNRLINVNVLDLSFNRITSVANLKNMKKLQKLHLHDNLLWDPNEFLILNDFQNLLEISLYNNVASVQNLANKIIYSTIDTNKTKIWLSSENETLVQQNRESKQISEKQAIPQCELSKLNNLIINNNYINFQKLSVQCDAVVITQGTCMLLGINRQRCIYLLVIDDCKVKHIDSLNTESPTMNYLLITNCSVQNIMLCTVAQQQYQNLTYLNLSNNKIEDLWGLSGLLKLKHLELQHNQIRNISKLSAIMLLQYIDLSHNYIDSLEPLRNVADLECLHIHNNRLWNCEEMQILSNFKQLHTISIYDNLLEDFDENGLRLRIQYSIIQEQISVYFIENEASIVEKAIIPKSPYIEQIRPPKEHQQFMLSCLVSKQFSNESFQTIQPNLRIIKIKDSYQLLSLDGIQGSKDTLEVLELINCNQFNDANVFQNYRFTNLKQIKITQAQLNQVQFTKQQNLQLLHISNCQCTVFKGLLMQTYIITLILNNNYIQDMSEIKDLINIQHLDLSNNAIQSIINLQNLSQLTILNLENNRIQSIETLKQIKQLIDLNLKQNSLWNLDELQIFQGFTTLNQLDLYNNYLSNDEYIFETLNLYLPNSVSIVHVRKEDENEINDVRNALNNKLISLRPLQDTQQHQQMMSRNVVFFNDYRIANCKDLFKEIEKLWFIQCCGLTSLSYLFQIASSIQDLKIENCMALQDVTQLKSCINLRCLSIINQPMVKSIVIPNSHKIETLIIRRVGIEELFQQNLPQTITLKNLELSECQISNFSFLRQFHELKHLNLSSTPIKHSNWLMNLNYLESLNLSSTNTQFLFLKKFQFLTQLTLNNSSTNKITIPKHLRTADLTSFACMNERFKLKLGLVQQLTVDQAPQIHFQNLKYLQTANEHTISAPHLREWVGVGLQTQTFYALNMAEVQKIIERVGLLSYRRIVKMKFLYEFRRYDKVNKIKTIQNLHLEMDRIERVVQKVE